MDAELYAKMQFRGGKSDDPVPRHPRESGDPGDVFVNTSAQKIICNIDVFLNFHT